jgi:hypothetical protein
MADDQSTPSTVPNSDLEHTAGGVTTRDGMDAGVPMTPGQPNEPVGPEDALGPGPKRGDYTDRIERGPHMVTRTIPDDERQARAEKMAKDAGTKSGVTAAMMLGDVPRTELVPADDAVGNIGDAPGKGGVSTAEATSVLAAETAAATGTAPPAE